MLHSKHPALFLCALAFRIRPLPFGIWPWALTTIKAVQKPPKPPRAETREIVELRQLREDQPDLAQAIDLQIELLQLQRRVQTRVPLPAMNLDAAHLEKVLSLGKPILAFEQVPVDWSDLRFL